MGSQHSDGLGEVARLVDVASALHGQVVGQQLQWHHGEDALTAAVSTR
jgi:hypothetical protein